jgi:hypothetical protein
MRRVLGRLSAIMLVLGACASGDAFGADRFVVRRGHDSGNDCAVPTTPCKSLEHALAVAASGDTLNLGAGKFHTTLRLDASTELTVLGGWDATFSTRDPSLNVTVLKPRTRRYPTGFADRRVVTVVAAAGETITLTLDGVTITKGTARTGSAQMGDPVFPLPQDGGGGVYAHAAGGSIALAIRDSAITANRSRIIAGGGVFLGASAGGSLDATFDRVRLTANTAEYAGAIEAVSAGSPDSRVGLTVVNAIIADNHTEGAAALFVLQYVGQAVLDLRSSTIVGNTAKTPKDEDPEGAIVLNGSLANVSDTIVWGNTLSPVVPGADMQVGQFATANVDHSDLGDVQEPFGGVFNDGGGNVSLDPLLVAFKLPAGSPLIDAGTCVGAPPTDIEGDPRPTGAGCDIGADEFVP